MCGLEETYRLIERMIDSISSCFRSSRIHIGMDEAHGMGEGRYKNYFGHQEHTRIFMDHLKQVHHICLRKGLKPLIWSDSKCFHMLNHTSAVYIECQQSFTPVIL